MPILTPGAPLNGVYPNGDLARPVTRSWEQHPPATGGHMSLLFWIANARTIDVARFAPRQESSRAFRNLFAKLMFGGPMYPL